MEKDFSLIAVHDGTLNLKQSQEVRLAIFTFMRINRRTLSNNYLYCEMHSRKPLLNNILGNVVSNEIIVVEHEETSK